MTDWVANSRETKIPRPNHQLHLPDRMLQFVPTIDLEFDSQSGESAKTIAQSMHYLCVT
jgi:hypothetical protein